ncbi:response regulator receiver domain [uncultured Acinetobacter sp.]|uniref:response regulator receiver domain n=1 Tax=uncultured Acinetobacter sp. TaxID=165433 RepID=UPI0025D5E4EF|nr:response regulator receiver domain [uncultured Acinetobacter sp.]
MNTQVQGVMTQNFFDVSRSIAEKFIQTVVAVDDKITFGGNLNKAVEEPMQVVVPPQDVSGLGESVQEQVSSVISEPINKQDDNELNYQELSEGFAEKSILCTALKTFSGIDGEEKTINATLNLAKKADITILDWQMENDATRHGEIAKGVIDQLLAHDVNNNGRLRLILLYTSADIGNVITKLVTTLNEHAPEAQDENSIIFPNESLKLCRIFVIKKTENIQELVDTSIQKFTEMTCGLLSNATLAAITEIRDKTHHHLYKFNSKLDTAYISHVIGLISSPEMRESAHEVAFDYAVDLISEELKSDLQTSKYLKDSLTSDTLKKWPLYKNPENQDKHSITVGEKDPVVFNNERMQKILSVKTDEELQAILDESPVFPKIGKKNRFDSFRDSYIQFKFTDEDNRDEHLQLSAIECLRRDPLNISSDFEPVLKQGTVIRKDDTYFVCIQPICDSVRLTCATSFLFLKSEKLDNTNFSHVIRHSEGYKCLRFKSTSRFVSLIEFTPTNKMVRATKQENINVFQSTNEDVYEWCGELKQAIYQELVNAVSASIARVGFDSFEWLRLRRS